MMGIIVQRFSERKMFEKNIWSKLKFEYLDSGIGQGSLSYIVHKNKTTNKNANVAAVIRLTRTTTKAQRLRRFY